MIRRDDETLEEALQLDTSAIPWKRRDRFHRILRQYMVAPILLRKPPHIEIRENSYLVKKVVFPVELLPIIKLASCFFVHLCFIVIMLVAFLVSGKTPMLSWLQIIYYSFAASVLVLGLGYLTSAVNVFFKDMQQIVGICLQFGIWMCPIMYDETLFTSRAPWVGTLLKLNPLYYIVAGYRDSMLTGAGFWMRPTLGIYFWVVTLVIFFVGLSFFRKLRPHFSDVL